MGIKDWAQSYSLDILASLILPTISYFTLNRFSIDESAIQVFVAVGLFVGSFYISSTKKPVIEFYFSDERESIILCRESVDRRTDDFSITVEIEPKFCKIIDYLHLTSRHLSNVYFQIYWDPIDSLDIYLNNNYSSIKWIDRYPAICMSDLRCDHRYRYQLKVAFTSGCQEIISNEIKIRKINKDPMNLWCRFLLCVLKVKSGTKKVEIRR